MMRAGMFKGKLRRSRQAAPAGTGPQRAPGSLIAGPECRLDGAMARAAARRDGERPYSAPPSTGPDTAAFRRLGATFSPHPAPVTAPMAVLPVAPEAPEAVSVLQKVADRLHALDWEALDAAKSQAGLTYARTTGAPIHNALAAEQRTPLGDPQRPAWRLPVEPNQVRHGEAVRRRTENLDYPSYYRAEAAGLEAYAGVMKHADRITGTRGTGRFHVAIAAGGAR